jgi:hypothetical protein
MTPRCGWPKSESNGRTISGTAVCTSTGVRIANMGATAKDATAVLVVMIELDDTSKSCANRT